MPTADHCLKALPKVTPATTYLQVVCPVCFSLWIYEKKKWTQLTLEEQRRQGLVPS
jgi:hypothetical protein